MRRAATGDLKTRLISALVLAPVVLAAVAAGGIAFAALVAAVAAIGFWEWTGIAAVPPAPVRIFGLVLISICLLALVLLPMSWPVAVLVAAGFLALAAAARNRTLGWSGVGLLYAALPCAAFIALRESGPDGWAAILFILAVVWTTDTAAYFGGRSLGGPKLWPAVSPKKTWSGAITGILGAVVIGGLVAALTGKADPGAGVALAGALSVASQAGDLFESAVKRRFGVKDSGHLIPGHGGVLDRVDGLLAAAGLAWLFAALGLGGRLLSLQRELPVLPGGAA